MKDWLSTSNVAKLWIRSRHDDLCAVIILLGPSTSAVLLLQSGYVSILVSDNVETPVPGAGTRRLVICVPKVKGDF